MVDHILAALILFLVFMIGYFQVLGAILQVSSPVVSLETPPPMLLLACEIASTATGHVHSSFTMPLTNI
eukprot:scaffold47439_cov34-Prasinocladus_malaysianus.AAC.1